MRPIKLKIRGLNSFEEEQYIDFTKLMEKGLFGIFGPTGSGKSTVLDGMILALYGMKAISRGANEFINKNCQSAAVSYEFQISSGKVRKYRAEREFKAGVQGVKAGKCRLLEVTEGEVVLEDSVRGMDRACVDIVGLNAEDFMRTVVLPQGKFSEFLRVGGKDRREILERLFGLEEYGKRLEEKLAAALREVLDKKTNLQGQMEAYGMANGETLKELERQAKQCGQRISELSASLETAAHELVQHREVRKLKEELLDGERHLKGLAEQAACVEEQKKVLRQAKLAQDTAPLLQAYQELYEESERLLQSIREKEREYEELDARKKERERLLLDISMQREKEEQPLRGRLQTAREALEDWESLPKLQREEKKLSAEKEEAEQRAKELEAKLEQIRKKEEDGQGSIENLEVQCKELKVQARYRAQVDEGLRLEEKAGKLRGDLEEKKKKINVCLKKVEKEQKREQSLCKEADESRERCGILNAQVEKQKQDVQAYRAYLLRQELEEGMPCPVCGAVHHERQVEAGGITEMPKAREETGESEAALKAEEGRLQKTLSKIEGSRSVLETLKAQLSEETDAHGEAEKRCGLADEELHRQRAELGIESFSKEWTHLLERGERLEQLEQTLTKLRKDQKSYAAKQEELRHFREEYKERSNSLSVKLAPIRESIVDKKARVEAKLGKKQNPKRVICGLEEDLERLLAAFGERQRAFEESEEGRKKAELTLKGLRGQSSGSGEAMEKAKESLEREMTARGFGSIAELKNALLDEESRHRIESQAEHYDNELKEYTIKVRQVRSSLGDRSVSKEELDLEEERYVKMQEEESRQKESLGELRQQVKSIRESLDMQAKLDVELKAAKHRESILEDLKSATRGKRFVEFMASQRLKYISKSASLRLSEITNGNYELETVGAGEFMIRDNKNGGVLRSPGTLSGGETFVTSLALALALSAEIQLKGTAPLELFFLDEGFGSLDENLLDVVMNSLERIQNDHLKVGLISHVEAVKARVPVRLVVTPAASGIGGSRVHIEYS